MVRNFVALACVLVGAVSSKGQTPPKAAMDLRIQPSVQSLVRQLQSRDDTQVKQAIRDLFRRGPEIIPELLKHFFGSDRTTVDGVATVFERMGELAIPELVPSLNDPNVDNRLKLMELFARMGSRAAVPALLGKCSERDAVTRAAAIQTLGRIRDRRAIPILLYTVTSDPEPLVREVGWAALFECGPNAAEAIPELVRLVTAAESADQDEVMLLYRTRTVAIVMLTTIGPKAMPALRKLLRDEDVDKEAKKE